jgi:hypothetical protein
LWRQSNEKHTQIGRSTGNHPHGNDGLYQKSEAEPAQAVVMEHDTPEPAFTMTDTNGYVNEFAMAVTDPPFINFDKYLNL